MKITDYYILLYGHDWPSNFAPSPIRELDKFSELNMFERFPPYITFKTAEAYYQSRKAVFVGDKERYYKIATAKIPSETKKIARGIKLDSRKWNIARVKFMWETLQKKFEQNPDLMEKLLDERLDGKKFIEASPTDAFWGAGKSEEQILRMMDMKEDPLEFDFETDLPCCMNMLGELLTKLRNFELKKKG